jgi:LysR family nitrogen assimilation transcriptional regulator
MLDLRRLRYFAAIGDHGSLSQASRVLNISQPALSHHVAALESELGTQLLERLPQGVVLTRAGRVLHDRAQRIIEDVACAEQAVREAATGQRHLAVALLPTIAMTVTPALLEAAETELPGVSLRIIEGRTEQNHRAVQAGEIDFAVDVADPRWPEAEPLGYEPLYLVERATERPCARCVSFAELASRRLIMPANSTRLRQVVQVAARDAGIDLNIAMEIDGLQSIKEAIKSGHGSTISSWYAVQFDCAAGTLTARRIVEPSVERLLVLDRSARTDEAITASVRRLVVRALRQAGPLRDPSDDGRAAAIHVDGGSGDVGRRVGREEAG